MDAPVGWKITFDDEFSVLDLASYSTSFFWGAHWLEDGEQQIYVDPAYAGSAEKSLNLNPFVVSDGVLQIQASIAPVTVQGYLHGQKYLSGLLTTYNSLTQLYGYFEIRARMPSGKGYWPAFWLLPKVALPKPPEIDVVEVLGDQLTTLYTTAHWLDNTQIAKSKGFAITVPNMSVDFHRYGVLWTSAYIAWYFDGSRVASMDTPSNLHAPMYLLLNLAVGGKWPGAPNRATKFPGSLFVDYIRVFAAP